MPCHHKCLASPIRHPTSSPQKLTLTLPVALWPPPSLPPLPPPTPPPPTYRDSAAPSALSQAATVVSDTAWPEADTAAHGDPDSGGVNTARPDTELTLHAALDVNKPKHQI